MLHDCKVMFREIAHQSGFSIERLASLCEIAVAGSIGQASQGDPNRQSLLSRQMAELEAVFGTALLSRQSRPFRLTEAGMQLAQVARLLFQVADDVRSRSKGGERRVVIGAGEMLIQWLLFPASEVIRQADPDWRFAFKNRDSEGLTEGLLQGDLDMALMRLEDVPASLSRQSVLVYQHTAFVPARVCRKTAPLELRELADLPWAVLEGGGHFRSFLDARAEAGGFRLNAALECSSYTQVAMAVQTGRYAGFLPDFAQTAFMTNPRLIRRPLGAPMQYGRSLVLAWKEAVFRSRPFLQSLLPLLSAQMQTTMCGNSRNK